MLNTKKIKIIIVEGISELQFLHFLTQHFCQLFCIKPLVETEQKHPMIEKIQGKIKNIYSGQEKSLIALDFNGKSNITEEKIGKMLFAINETDPGLEFEILIIVDNDADPTTTAKDLKTIIEELKIRAEDFLRL
jgi:hypothetical protein